MPKLGELNYVKAIGPEGVDFALNKPFGGGGCGRYLADLGRIMELLPPVPARVLDLGVGSGWTSTFLARRGYDVVGQDICPDMIDLANQNRDRTGTGSIAFVVQDYESMGYREEFDAAVFYDALHHAEDERVALAGVYKALKPGRVCITVEPGEGHSVASAHTAEKYGVTEKDMPPHHIITLGRELGFRQFRVYPRAAEPEMACWFDRTRPLWPARPGRWRVAARFVRKAVRTVVKGARGSDQAFLFDTPPEAILRAGNLVWLQK
ncbi:MAG: cap guanine-N2 methyltransferase family protein [Gemmataceae bacterium]|nr:cap guanine-N2 methyltransferase family protein [Gemmataceae bacterium]